MHAPIKNKTIILMICLLPLYVTAQTNVSNKRLACLAKHLYTDDLVTVKTVSSLPGGKLATAQWPLGYPTIVIDDNAFLKLPDNVQHFIYYHECAHLALQSDDEHEVDCKSIDLLVENKQYTALDVRRLMQTLKQAFGLSKRWSELLNCKSFQKLTSQ